jgi:hypothetical protein
MEILSNLRLVKEIVLDERFKLLGPDALQSTFLEVIFHEVGMPYKQVPIPNFCSQMVVQFLETLIKDFP